MEWRIIRIEGKGSLPSQTPLERKMEKTNAKAEAYKEISSKLFWIRHSLVEVWNEMICLEDIGDHEISDKISNMITQANLSMCRLDRKARISKMSTQANK